MRSLAVKIVIIATLFMLFVWGGKAFGQTDSIGRKWLIKRYEMVDGDSMPVYYGDEVIITQLADPEAQKKYLRLVRDVKKVLPYAKLAAFRLQLMEDNLRQITDKKERKEYQKLSEQAIKDEFTDDLNNLTVNQGRLLIKLINRETGKTTYEILDEHTGKLTTIFWSSMAQVFGGDLKETFDPVEDFQIEYIIKNLQLE